MSEVAEIAVLKAKRDSLRAQLKEAEAALLAAEVKAAGVAIGDVVVVRGIEYRVCEVDPKWGGKPWLKGNPRKKDGSWGIAVRSLYSDWRLPA